MIFLVYGMLPMKTGVALAMGLLLPAMHLLVSASFTPGFPSLRWQQLLGKTKGYLYFLPDVT